jgi:hypothetical protein
MRKLQPVVQIHVLRSPSSSWYAFIRVEDLRPSEIRMLMRASVFNSPYDRKEIVEWINGCRERLVGSSRDPSKVYSTEYSVVQTYTVRDSIEAVPVPDIDAYTYSKMIDVPPHMTHDGDFGDGDFGDGDFGGRIVSDARVDDYEIPGDLVDPDVDLRGLRFVLDAIASTP